MGNKLSQKGLLHLLVVYTVWSSTYLAIRIAVDPANGFPPFMMGASRMVLAAFVLLGVARLRGKELRLSRDEMITLSVSGTLLWVFGNGAVLWAEQYADSGFSCLMVSSAPIWATLIELIFYNRRPSLLLAGSLILGFLGVLVLTLPSMAKGVSTDLYAVGALLVSAVSWALGSVLQSHRPVKLSPQVMSGYQHLFATVGFLVIAFLLREPLPQPTVEAWGAWGYLVIFGSVLAFTSFIFALKLLPISIAMTYAYVNPFLALGLGWLILDEPITLWTVFGACLVIMSVGGIFASKHQADAGESAVGQAAND